MPSALHEAIVELFRQRPVLAAELLRETLAVPLPEFTAARIESAAFTDLKPPEYRADLVVLLAAEQPVLGIVVEVQLRIDPQKRYSWPHYAATLRVRQGCPTCVVVYAPDADVAAWAAAAIPGGPGWSLQPLVLGPHLIPVVTHPEQAAARPELAVLSAMAHGHHLPPHEAALMAMTAVRAVANRDDDLAMLYYDLIGSALPDAARKAFEAMKVEDYEFKTELGRKWAASMRESRAKGKAEAVLQFLTARGIDVPEAIRQRVLACTDPAVLDGWIRRAALAATAAEVVSGDS